jgi:hypothetical protein
MTDDRDKPVRTADGAKPADAKAERLAAALKENLKRRKAQARGRRDMATASREDGPSDATGNGDN